MSVKLNKATDQVKPNLTAHLHEFLAEVTNGSGDILSCRYYAVP